MPKLFPVHSHELYRGTYSYEENGVELLLFKSDGSEQPVRLSSLEIVADNDTCLLFTLLPREAVMSAEHTLSYRLKVEALISTISARFFNISSNDMNEALQLSIEEIGKIVETDRSYIYKLIDGKFVNTHEWMNEGLPSMKYMQNAENPEDYAWIHDKLANNEVVHLPSIEVLRGVHDKLRERLQYQGIKSTLAVPIMSVDKGIKGFLGFDNLRSEKFWDEEDIGILRVVGEILANAYERQRYETSLKRINIELLELTSRQEKMLRERTASLTRANRQLTIAVRELDVFVYRAAHDLKGPIKRLLGLINVAEYECDELVSTRYLDMFRDIARDMDRGLSKLLIINEISTHDPEITEIPLRDLIEEAIGEVEEYLDTTNVTFNIADDEENRIISSVYLMKIILVNIIENAIFFSKLKNADPCVDIWWMTYEDRVEVIVKDNGIGISPEIKPRVTEMFYRGSNESIGNGLGLYLAEKALEKLNGELKIDSVNNKYTSCHVIVPLA